MNNAYDNDRNALSKRPSQSRKDKALQLLTGKLTLGERRAVLGLFTEAVWQASCMANRIRHPHLLYDASVEDAAFEIKTEMGSLGTDMRNCFLTSDEQDAIENDAYAKAEARDYQRVEDDHR